MDETIEERLSAVERALTDGDQQLSEFAAAAGTTERLNDLDADIEALDDRVAELEAATQALRGYVGHVRAVNEEVEQRADLALETAEAATTDATETESTRSGRPPATTEPTRTQSGKTRSQRESLASQRRCFRDTTGCDDREETARPDPTALANSDGEQPPNGTATEAEAERGVLARIRDLV
jgi:ABC-type transporter Mla subunit MlaD